MGDIVADITDLYRDNDWRAILERYHDHPDRSKLLWVFPSEESFGFISGCVKDLGCDRMVSVGCGTGLLEWMITAITGIPVTGIEVDSAWWHCKYAPPTFIPLLLTPPELEKDTIEKLQTSNTALLFCYFNNRAAFENYLKYYSGNVLIIIGPDGKGVHTDPKPFGDVMGDWVIHKSQEVRSSGDFIVVYSKIKMENHIPF